MSSTEQNCLGDKGERTKFDRGDWEGGRVLKAEYKMKAMTGAVS